MRRALARATLLVTRPDRLRQRRRRYTRPSTPLNKPDVKILTVEDPVEYQMSGWTRSRSSRRSTSTFANALRSIVRQDPDVIMIGEIRDLETAQIAVQSALTGHLVLSTLHTNDAPSSLNRLLDMGVEDYLLTSTVVGVEAQQLLHHAVPPYVAQGLRAASGNGQRRWGCRSRAGGRLHSTRARLRKHYRSHTGYIGRMCIMEIMPMTDRIRSLVMRHATATELRGGNRTGMMTMYDHGLRKVSQGIPDA
ncbi:MAG: Flp pilus assembly complex ATPase component TadA [Betaproteobacteria bacterium]|nr:Flp pilus assembly complex ATPase component TadA [Betaproteobacteria bacterium]